MSQAPNADVMADAERWFARLKAQDCTASERLEFQRWRALPGSAEAYAATEKLWQSLGQLAGRSDLEQLSRQILAETATPPRRSWLGFAAAASILIAVLVGGVFLAVQSRQAPAVAYTTQAGERSTIKLADGSQLTLNFATELDVRLDAKARHIRLHRGEALFTVAHDEKRPFIVAAAGGEVTALGTRFQVRNEDKRVAITLLEGRVSVDRRETREHRLLSPGDQLVFTAAMPAMKHRTVDPEIAGSWVTGRLLFRSTPLSEVIAEVNRYSETKIRLADASLAGFAINGTFEIGDGASVATAIAALLPLRAVAGSDGEILLQRQ